MRVHILGGGIGGMSAALHLARLAEAGVFPKDLKVHVYEAAARYGGKASSQFSPLNGDAGNWPGEHGFRFFPNFYRCVVDTLRFVPVTEAHVARRSIDPKHAGASVFSLLTSVGEGAVAVRGGVHHIPRAQSLEAILGAIRETVAAFQVTPEDAFAFSNEIAAFLICCEERALVTWENMTLDDLLARHQFTQPMVMFIRSLRALSAMRAERGSLRTLLFTAIQMLADFDPQYHLRDALLPGPTDYMMLEPWEHELERLGVTPHFQHEISALEFTAPRFGLTSRLSRVALRGETAEILAGAEDVFVLALPYERARALLLAANQLPAGLVGIRDIDQRSDNLGIGAEPMVGIQYWLSRDVPIAGGHVLYPAAQWAVTSVSQAQFWKSTFTKPIGELFGAKDLRGVLSAIVSGWDVVSDRLGKAPRDCSNSELAEETFAQIVDGVGAQLKWGDVIGYHVDANVAFGSGSAFCSTPLWVSPKGSYVKRPFPDVRCGNLFLASDWARTGTDVGSMESADEAARRAVFAIAQTLPQPPPDALLPEVRPLRLWPAVELARDADRWMFQHGLPPALSMTPADRKALANALRGLRDAGDSTSLVDAFREQLPPWMGLVDAGPGRVEVDQVLRFLDALEVDGGDQSQTSREDLLAKQLSGVSRLV